MTKRIIGARISLTKCRSAASRAATQARKTALACGATYADAATEGERVRAEKYAGLRDRRAADLAEREFLMTAESLGYRVTKGKPLTDRARIAEAVKLLESLGYVFRPNDTAVERPHMQGVIDRLETFIAETRTADTFDPEQRGVDLALPGLHSPYAVPRMRNVNPGADDAWRAFYPGVICAARELRELHPDLMTGGVGKLVAQRLAHALANGVDNAAVKALLA